jgi:VanZ family protein
LFKYLKKNRNWVLLFPLILYWIILFIGTTLPSDRFSNIVDIGDKLKHFSAYSILAFLLSLNLFFQEKWEYVSKNYLAYTLIICILYGAFDEIHQFLVPNRSAEFLDWFADILGSIIGSFFAYLFIQKNSTTVSYET